MHQLEGRRSSITRGTARVGAAVAALLLGLLAVAVVQQWLWLENLDDSLGSSIHRWALENSWAVEVARALGTIGGVGPSVIVAALTLVVMLVARRGWTALTVAVVAVLAPILAALLQNLVDRPPPTWVLGVAVETGSSFPSGQATGGIAVWCVCGVALASLLRDPSWAALFALPWLLLGVAIGVARLVLGVNWPSDVVAGWCLALAVLGVAASLFVLPAAVATRERPLG